MLKKLRYLPRQTMLPLLDVLRSHRQVARVVTPRGIHPRGYPPARKCPTVRFQSLVEEDCLRVLEVAKMVSAYETHPLVLELGSANERLSYTPDVLVWMRTHGTLVEIKSAGKLSSQTVVTRLREVKAALARQGLPFVLMLDTDARDGELQRELKELQRLRPARGRFRGDLDPTAWDAGGMTSPGLELLERWKRAQQVCDDLLTRVMRRDPDDLLSVKSA